MSKGDTDPIWKTRLRQKPRSSKAARIQKLLKAFEQSQWWDPEDIEAKQFRLMSSLLAHAQFSISHYAENTGSVNPRDVKSLKAGRWLELPVLKRDTVNSLGDDLLSRNIPKAHGSLDPIYTSGTTGKPVRVVRTSFALNYWSAFTSRDHIWHNRNIKGVLAAIRSSDKDFALYPKGADHAAWGAKNGVFKTGPSMSLNVNTSIPNMVEWIARKQPDHLLSLPNIVKRLAPYCLEKGIKFPNLKEIQVHGEMCGDLMRQHCLEAWGVPVHDMYTSREIGYMALQCPVHDHYHVQSEGVYLEILDKDDQPCKPGETGRVIVTTLQNYAMPLIRYEVGDYAEVGEPCDCGRGMPVIKRILGREQDILVLPTGEQRWTLLGSPDVRHFMEMAPIVQYQLAHVAPDKMEVRLVTKRELTAQEEDNISQWVQKKLGYPFIINFVYFEDMALSRTGKFKDFVVEFSAATQD
jgi:phenylacetate-CoA ligase